jgi:hypothetical protein
MIRHIVLTTVKIALDLQVMISENLAIVTPDKTRAMNSAIPNMNPFVNIWPAMASKFSYERV